MSDLQVTQDDPNTAFPASENVPGQAQSRTAYQRFKRDYLDNAPWADAYLALRSDGWNWRQAAYIAWASIPSNRRLPKTQKELAHILGINNTRTIRKWRERYPEIDQLIEDATMAILGDALGDVISAWVDVAKQPDPSAHRDRITYLEHMKIYQPKAGLELTGKDGADLLPFGQLVAALQKADEQLADDDNIDDHAG